MARQTTETNGFCAAEAKEGQRVDANNKELFERPTLANRQGQIARRQRGCDAAIRDPVFGAALLRIVPPRATLERRPRLPHLRRTDEVLSSKSLPA